MERNRRRTLGIPQFLSGWKEIAHYLGKGVRTIQRYEREFGLPVRRPAGRVKGSVVATKGELDAWVKASPIREAYQILPRVPNPSTNPLSEIKRNVKEMQRLRDQMSALRAAVASTIEILHESVDELNREMAKNWERNNVPILLQEWDSGTQQAFTAVSAAHLPRKVS